MGGLFSIGRGSDLMLVDGLSVTSLDRKGGSYPEYLAYILSRNQKDRPTAVFCFAACERAKCN
jgi:hypothetical protein